MARSKDPFAAQRKALYANDRRQIESWNKPIQAQISKNVFKNRPSNNPLYNALLDVKDYGQGLSTVASMVPSLAKVAPGYIHDVATGKIPFSDVAKLAGGVAKAVVKGYAENYGQEQGLNAGNALKSFVKHPMNILDVLPIAEVAKGSGTVAKAVSKMGKAGAAFSKMGEIPRIQSNLKVTNPEVLKAIKSGEKLTPDSFIKFATQSGANQYGKGYKGAGELKNFKSLTPGQQHTFAHIYGEQFKNIPNAQQKQILDTVKQKLGVESLKDIPEEQLSNLVSSVRKELPGASNVDLGSARIARNPRAPEPDITPLKGGLEKTLGKGKQLFTAGVLSNPAWITGNMAGDLYHTLTGGENLYNVIKEGLNPEISKLVTKSDLGGFYKDTGKAQLALEAANKAENPLLTKLTSYADPFFKFEGKRENVFRQGVFANQLQQLAKQSILDKAQLASKELGATVKADLSAKSIMNEAKLLAKRQEGYDKAIQQSKQVLGDYRSFQPWEKQLGAVVPFYKWFREASKIAAHQPVRNPLGYAGLKATSELGGNIQEQQANALQQLGYQIPDYNKGGFVSGLNSEGVPEIYNAGKLLPITTVSNLAESALKFPQGAQNYLSPILSTPMQVMSGTNFTGRPATAPNVFEDYNGRRYYVDPQKQSVQPLNEGELPNSEALNYMVSSMLRNFTPLGTIERYMPIRTYDTRIFQPDVTRPEKSGSSFIRNMGLGTTSRAYKIPNTDTDRVLQRALKKLNPQ